jgi:hypothetical protein
MGLNPTATLKIDISQIQIRQTKAVQCAYAEHTTASHAPQDTKKDNSLFYQCGSNGLIANSPTTNNQLMNN